MLVENALLAISKTYLFDKQTKDFEIDDYQFVAENINFETMFVLYKASGRMINMNTGNLSRKDSSLQTQIEEYVEANGSEQDKAKWKAIKEEACLINNIFLEYSSFESEQLSKLKRPLEAFLILLEEYSIYANQCRASLRENKKIEFAKDGWRGQFRDYDLRDFGRFHDTLTQAVNSVLACLVFYYADGYDMQSEEEIDEAEVEAAFSILNTMLYNHSLNLAAMSWNLSGRKLEKVDGLTTFLFADNVDLNRYIFNVRKDEHETKAVVDFGLALRKANNQISKGNRITDCISDEELIMTLYLMDYLYVDDLNECLCRIDDDEKMIVSVKEVLRAYHVLKDICLRKREDRSEKCVLNAYACILTEEEIKELFVKNGIRECSAKIIIRWLTYSKNTDIFDAPLIQKNGFFYLMPFFVLDIDYVKTIMSLVKEFDKRGSNFEDRVLKAFKKAGLEACSLHIHREEEFQCDVVAAVANDIYFCECKAWNNTKSLKGYENYLKKCIDAKAQLDRIAMGLVNEEQEIRNKLFGGENRKIKNIHKIVITLNMQSLDNQLDDTFFIDASALFRFLTRNKPGIRESGKVTIKYEPTGFKEFDGEINNYKFETFLKSPAQVEIQRKGAVIMDCIIDIGEDRIVVKNYAQCEPVMIFKGSNTIYL